MKMKSILGILLMLPAALLQAAPDSLMVHEPYIRALPPGVTNSAAYMQLMNHGEQDIEIVSLSSSVSDKTSFHETVDEGGMLHMQALDSVTVPAHGEVALTPGGIHVMMIGLQQSLAEGDSVMLTLEFADGDSMNVEVPVLSMQQTVNQNMDHHQH